ncbi:hypothetical protein EV714DRAFT_222546 [Schizophyllum commune]
MTMALHKPVLEVSASALASSEQYLPYERFVSFCGLNDAATALSFSPDGTFIAAADRTKMIVRRLDQPHFPAVKAPSRSGRKTIVALAWVYFEKRRVYAIVTGSFEGEVSLWHLEGECKSSDASLTSDDPTPDLLVFGYQGGVIVRLDQEGKSVVNLVKGPGIMASVEMLTSTDQCIAYTGLYPVAAVVCLLVYLGIQSYSVRSNKYLGISVSSNTRHAYMSWRRCRRLSMKHYWSVRRGRGERRT